MLSVRISANFNFAKTKVAISYETQINEYECTGNRVTLSDIDKFIWLSQTS